jgi:hypothetical protein
MLLYEIDDADALTTSPSWIDRVLQQISYR